MRKKVKEVQIDENTIYYTLKENENKTYQTGEMNDSDLVNRLQDANVDFSQKIHQSSALDNPIIYFLITFMLPIFILSWLMRRSMKKMRKKMGGDDSTFTFTPGGNEDGNGFGGFGGFGNLGKSNAKVYEGKKTGITFDDVAGQQEAKDNLVEIVDFLNNPKNMQKLVQQCQKVLY